MAGNDTIKLNLGTGGDDLATFNKGGDQYQKVMMEAGDSPSIDAFGRFRVSSPTTLLFDTQLTYNLQNLLWEDSINGSATVAHDANASLATMTVTAAAGDSIVRQTRKYIRYQPGRSQLILITAELGSATAGVNKRVGYFDGDNGVFLEQNGITALSVVTRSKASGSVVNTKVVQASWNLDNMDGDGDAANPSGITLDITKSQIIIIDLQWLGVGRVRIGFVIDGVIHYVHQFTHANSGTDTYMSTANLPIRYEIESDGTNTDSMKAICAAVSSEGGAESALAFHFSASSSTSHVTVNASDIPIISIRPKDTFNSITNRADIFPESVSFLSNNDVRFRIIYGGTLTDESFASADDASAVEVDTSATAIVSGINLETYYVEKNQNSNLHHQWHVPIALNASGNHPTTPYTDIFTVVGDKLSANANVYVAINWREQK